MSIRVKLVAAAGAVAMVALTPAAAEARTKPKVIPATPYAVGANQNAYNITCAPAAKAGKATIKLRITRNTNKVTPSELGDTNGRTSKWVATWDGGSIDLGSIEKFYASSKTATFPCPTSASAVGAFTISVQSYVGTTVRTKKGFTTTYATNGKPATYNVATHRVGSAS